MNPSTITIRQDGFSPSPKTVYFDGDTAEVCWVNEDAESHTVAADDGSWCSSTILPGAIYQHLFTLPGTWNYHCNLHPKMQGQITVSVGE